MSRTTTGFVTEKKAISIFFSYAHQDEKYRDKLEQHLGFLKSTTQLTTWHDRKIMPGEGWDDKIDDQLNLADIILLLISPDFASSEYCWSVETKRALERKEQGDALVIPIIIRPVAGWENTPIGRLQALPKDGKPVVLWRNLDEAYRNIVEGLLSVINNWSGEIAYAEPDWVHWSLKLDGHLEDYSEKRINSITEQLREATNSEKLECLDSSPGSVELHFRSTQPVFDTLKALHAEGKLQQTISDTILELRSDLGAVMRIESRIIDNEYQSTIRYLPALFGERSLEEGFPPLVGGIAFPLHNPMQIGFSLLSDSSLGMPTPEEQTELQERLGRYLNTFLVLTGDQVNVTLTPIDDYCGLPKLLRHTELGRDMLAQDVVLKHYTACQLHPSTVHGRAFWDEVGTITTGSNVLESCFRVWIMPDGATLREKTEDEYGYVSIEKLGLKVLCDADYDTLRQLRELQGKHQDFFDTTTHDKHVIDMFKKLIVPVIQREVSTGARFGLLRQILSVLVIAKWIMGSQLGEALKKAGFLDSNNPEKYGLNTVSDDVLHSMKRLYLEMVDDGIWTYTRTHIDIERNVAQKRLYVAGGIDLNWKKIAQQGLMQPTQKTTRLISGHSIQGGYIE